MGHRSRRRQQIRAVGHLLIAKRRLARSYPRKGDTKQQASGRPIILHVQQPDGVIVAMLPINDPLIQCWDSDRTWPNARVAQTAIARIAPPSGLARARRSPRARATGCPLLSPL